MCVGNTTVQWEEATELALQTLSVAQISKYGLGGTAFLERRTRDVVKGRQACARSGYVTPDPEIEPGSNFIPVSTLLRCFSPPIFPDERGRTAALSAICFRDAPHVGGWILR